MTIKIYGVARSRAFRDVVDGQGARARLSSTLRSISPPARRAPPHLALNPNGHVPVIDDDGFILWESMAINLYLAKKYGSGELYPSRLEDEARAWQWSFWGMTEVERPVLTAMFNRAILPEDKRDACGGGRRREVARRIRSKCSTAFSARPLYLLGDDFTVADLNVASILAWARPAQIDISPFPKVAEWLKNCAERPAARAARQMQRE